LEQKASSVEDIINALAELEKDMDNINSMVEEMRKRIIVYSDEEVEKLKQQIITIANDEAKKIIDGAKTEAETESSMIVKEADGRLADIKKNIDSSYYKAVDSIVMMVLGNTISSNIQQTVHDDVSKATETAPNKIKKYTSEGKPSQDLKF
jgi:vacuolar-type H+-ATPase subunit H